MKNSLDKSSFTNNQWYFYEVKQTVFYACFADERFSRDDLISHVHNIAKLAPQLKTGFATGHNASGIDAEIVAKMVDVQTTQNLDDYPDDWDMQGSEIFEQTDVPLLRIKAVNLVNQKHEHIKDEHGRAAALLILSSHALFEGEDAANVAREQSVYRTHIKPRKTLASLLKRLVLSGVAIVAAPLQIIVAELFVPQKMDMKFSSIAIPRQRLKRLANRLGVRQRALFYALAVWTLHDAGAGFGKSKLSTIFAELDGLDQQQYNESFFQFRMVDAKMTVSNDFAQFAKTVDAIIKTSEATKTNLTQSLLNQMFKVHRWIRTRFPFLYSEKTFRYDAGYHLSLSLVSPMRPQGALTQNLLEPIFSGTFHPGLNSCVFTPGKTTITFNFSVQSKHDQAIANFESTLQKIEQLQNQ